MCARVAGNSKNEDIQRDHLVIELVDGQIGGTGIKEVSNGEAQAILKRACECFF